MLEIGRTISHCRAIEKLGQGGMGEVFLAHGTWLDRNSALNFLAKASPGDIPATDASTSPKLTDQMTRAGVILGTAAYTAPEQAKGRIVDKRTDNWAFGCLRDSITRYRI